jgi:hypothetical protein
MTLTEPRLPDRSGLHAPVPTRGGEAPMAMPSDKKAVSLVIAETELIELHRLLIDSDAEAALAWIRRHLGGKTLGLLEGG